jgi:hypothetical protein
MNFSNEQIALLVANGWEQVSHPGMQRFYRGSEWISISGNIVNWSGRCKTYDPSPENFVKWAKELPVYFDPAIKARLNSKTLNNKSYTEHL